MSRTDKDKPYIVKMWDDKISYHTSACKENKELCDLTESLAEELLNFRTDKRMLQCCWRPAKCNRPARYKCDCSWCLNGKVKKYGKRGVTKRQLKNYIHNYTAGEIID